MSKNYIDVPMIGYKTWNISVGYVDERGDSIDNPEPDLIRDLTRQYPYDPDHNHIR